MYKLCIKFMLLLPFLVACSGSDDSEWVMTDTGIRMYMTDSVGTFLTEKVYSWEGDSICGLAHGRGKLIISDRDNGKVLFSKRVEAYYGNLDEAIIGKVLNEKHPYYYYGDKENSEKNGFGVLLDSDWIYIGEFEDDKGDGMVSAFKHDTLKYVGEWSETLFSGKGKEFYPDGKIKYDGHWSEGTYDGRGIYYDENGIQHKHVWKDGALPESINQHYIRLETHKRDMSAETYAYLRESYYIWEVAYIWIYVGFVLALLILLRLLDGQYNAYSQNRYREIKPLEEKPLYIRWALGGMWGLHRARLGSRYCWFEYTLFAVFILSCVDNISMYILYPSVWLLLPQWSIVTKVSFLLMMAWWIVDAFWIPYGRYLYISKYFRRSEHELDILNGNVTQVESFYSGLSHTFDERNMRLKKYLFEAQKYAYEENPAEDWKKTVGGGMDFEKKKFENMQRISNEMNGIYHTYQEDNLSVKSYLGDARVAAVRNLYLAKELIQIVHSLKGKEQILLQDDLDVFDISIDITMPDMNIDIDGMVQNTVQNAMKMYSVLLRSGIGGKTAMTGGVVVAVASGVMDYIESRNEKRKELAEKSLELVNSMKIAMDKVVQTQAQILRASELLSALYNANKAFIVAYVDLRDLCFGEVSFRSFRNGAVKEQEAYETDEFKQAIQHLINVCNEYNKINKQTLKK